jgi:hypothetical protein
MPQLWLARSICIAHALIAASIVMTPFCTGNPGILRLYLVFCLAILMHWILNDNLCVMTVLEMRARGVTTRAQSLIHRVMEPFFTRSDHAQVHRVECAILLGLCSVAVYRIVRCD